MSSKVKIPPKLSPQERRVYTHLVAYKKASIIALYAKAQECWQGQVADVVHRQMQQHVGVLVARLNSKRRRTIIVPGGKKAPRTYVIRRRR